jgi:hypothetical protein
VAEKGSFISRFFYKLLEIMGAAVATAVSGYLVAHLGGFLPSRTQAPTPPAVAVVPSEHHPAPKAVPANAPASQPAATPQPTQSAAAPASPEAPDHRAAQSQPDTAGPAQPARKGANTKAAAAPPRKSGKSESAATEANRPRETPEAKARETTEAKARETTEAKAREAEDKESVEAQVRAALANIDANHPAPAEAPPRRGENRGPSAQPRPGETSPNTTAAIPAPASVGPGVQPRSADLGSPTQQPTVQPAAIQSPATQTAPAQPAPLQVAPVQPTPSQRPDALTTVEIKSRPVATIDTAPAPEAAPPLQEERGVLSVFKHILPDLRRPASSDEAPRPPASVGE